MSFGKDFVWGAATAACQIEGAVYEDGKGADIWNVFSAQDGNIYGNHTPSEGCDHYHHMREDVQCMKKMGLKAYRFSISWPRILPEGTGRINQAGIDFYNSLIDELICSGIEPYVTLYHWDLSFALHLQGGWANPKIVDWFGEYAKVVAENFSDRVKFYFTFNEPQCFVGLGYLLGMHAPGCKVSPQEAFRIAHHILLAHGTAAKILREYAKQKVQIGQAACGDLFFPASGKAVEVEAARRMMFAVSADYRGIGNTTSWFSDPVYLGHYPEDGLRRFEKYLPASWEKDMERIHQPMDFVGQNIYQGKCVYQDESGQIKIAAPAVGEPQTACGWPVTPECMYWGTRFLYERYGLPVLISENGTSCHDRVSLDGKVHDPNRIDFMRRYLTQLERAAADGVPVKGYFAWSLLDNYEWSSGYSQRFGLIYVDYRTKERIWKDSAHWYRRVIESDGGIL